MRPRRNPGQGVLPPNARVRRQVSAVTGFAVTGLAVTGLAAALVPACALASAALIVLMRPLLVRYALARPNARSSHEIPTPQGGGIAVVAAALGGGAAGLIAGAPGSGLEFVLVATGALVLAVVGAVDDVRPLPAAPRLAFQLAAVALVMAAVDGPRILPEAVPSWLERGLVALAGVWFVNLVNFMDGLDWMTVAEIVPVTGGLVLFGLAGVLPPWPTLVAAALLGAMLGFAPFNRPVARLFLGDVGSLPIGLLVGWMLLTLAGTGALAAAILLPLYYLADATLTLLGRLARGQKVWQAHRSHFYQRATGHGFSVLAVGRLVFGLNVALAMLAAATLIWPSPATQAAALAGGAFLVGLVLRRFSRPRPDGAA